MSKGQKIVVFVVISTLVICGGLIAYLLIKENTTLLDPPTTTTTTEYTTTTTTTTTRKPIEELKKEAKKISYDNLSRHPKDYYMENIVLKGKVLQITEGYLSGSYNLRVATKYDSWLNDYYEDVVLATIYDMDENNRILEDDIITMYGYSTDLTTYESVMGNNITIPSMTIQNYVLK